MEHRILQVYNVEEVNNRLDNERFVRVSMAINCRGKEEQVEATFVNMAEWENANRLGFYLA
jgi:RNA-binding protein YhbY